MVGRNISIQVFLLPLPLRAPLPPGASPWLVLASTPTPSPGAGSSCLAVTQSGSIKEGFVLNPTGFHDSRSGLVCSGLGPCPFEPRIFFPMTAGLVLALRAASNLLTPACLRDVDKI